VSSAVNGFGFGLVLYDLKQFQSYFVPREGGAGIYACGIAVKKPASAAEVRLSKVNHLYNRSNCINRNCVNLRMYDSDFL
jgi:hypothetical protein